MLPHQFLQIDLETPLFLTLEAGTDGEVEARPVLHGPNLIASFCDYVVYIQNFILRILVSPSGVCTL